MCTILWLSAVASGKATVEVADSLIIPRRNGWLPNRFDRQIENYLFVPRGQWVFGIVASYVAFDSRDSEILSLLKDFDCTAYTVKVRPFVGYFWKDNSAIGLKMGYERTFGRVDNLSLDIDDDLNFSVKDIYLLQHLYSATCFHRSYIGLSRNKRFGLFNETSLTVSGGKAKFVSGKGENVNGTYSQLQQMHVGLNPGLSVFIMNNVAAEVSFGVLGFKYKKESLVTNQVEIGSRRSSAADFKINLFDINIGITIYI